MRRLGLLLFLAGPAAALEQLNLLLPNDRSLPMGEIGSVEGSAVVARTSGASAGWYNPAGLAGQAQSEVMGSASIYDYTSTKVDSPFGGDERRTVSVLPGAAGLSEPLPEMFGKDSGWGVGLLVATPVYWRTSVAQQEGDPTPTGTVAVSNTYDATYEEYLPTLSIGRQFGRSRWGFSGAVIVHQLSVSSSSDLVRLPESQTISTTTQYHGRTILLRLGVGWQWDGDGWAVGATGSAPGIRIWQSGDRSDASVVNDPVAGRITDIRGSTTNYDLDLDSPAQATIAAARVAEDWSVELDLTLAFGTPQRDVFPSYTLQQTVVDGGVTTQGTATVAALSSNRRAVLNGAFGVSRRVVDNWSLHAGVTSDRSPIEDSQLFSKVDLWTVVGGVSVRGEHSLMTVGIASTWNTSGTSTAVDLPTGDEVESDLSIRTWRMIVGTSYRF